MTIAEFERVSHLLAPHDPVLVKVGGRWHEIVKATVDTAERALLLEINENAHQTP